MPLMPPRSRLMLALIFAYMPLLLPCFFADAMITIATRHAAADTPR